ncbi:PH domain-containing protein [Catellatospora sichuanensis]|uniref:PH domain-containing protein n=1 Tax=Catellatospora sichuanensis TaxID=1969805 RepID=UPI0011830CD3|nr:PH domain-containing protein [Catellatospora sichuanensis]
MGHGGVVNRGQNALVAAGMLVIALCGVGNVVAAVRRAEVTSVAGILMTGLGLAVWCAVWLTLAVRAATQGVFARPEYLLVRGLLRTWRIPWPSLRAVRIYEGSHGKGGLYYAPAIDFVVTPARTGRDGSRDLPGRVGTPPAPEFRTVNVHWLATVTEQHVQRHADRIRALAVESGGGLEGG